MDKNKEFFLNEESQKEGYPVIKRVWQGEIEVFLNQGLTISIKQEPSDYGEDQIVVVVPDNVEALIKLLRKAAEEYYLALAEIEEKDEPVS